MQSDTGNTFPLYSSAAIDLWIDNLWKVRRLRIADSPAFLLGFSPPELDYGMSCSWEAPASRAVVCLEETICDTRMSSCVNRLALKCI